MLVPVQETELSDIADGNVKWYNHFEIICLFLKRLSTHLPLNPIISLLGVHLREKKAYVHVKTCTYALLWWRVCVCVCTRAHAHSYAQFVSDSL